MTEQQRIRILPSLESAYVDLTVHDPRNVTTENFSGLTDEKGLFTHTWNINENAEIGKYMVYLDIIVPGYKPLAKSEIFTFTSGNTTENATNLGIFFTICNRVQQ